jgi:lipopolysaccharide/colanic/teichoic acid biosynthesis glycosyltransferase
VIELTSPYSTTVSRDRFGDELLAPPRVAPRDAGAPAAKRALDVGLAALLALACAPLLLVVAAAIKLVDGGPVIFWQTRIGKDGRSFPFPKFRSMRPGAERLHHTLRSQNHHGDDVTFKMRSDPRVTRLGRLLRMTSLDELPQLWSVLRGDMSLVGPRPPLPSEVVQYGTVERQRLDVKPGLTGLWQVHGRSTVPFAGQVAMDLQYIESWSLWLDLKILLQTIPAVLSCRGAW